MRELNLEPIQSVERAIHILNCFSYEKPELTIEDIMSKTKLAKATTYRLLWTLEKNGFIHYNQTTSKYRLGTGLLEYSGIILENLDIRAEADPYLLNLHEETGHSVILAQQQVEMVQYLSRYDTDDGLNPNNFVRISIILVTLHKMKFIMSLLNGLDDVKRMIKGD